MIYLFTDFGWAGPYVGEMKAVLARELPNVCLIDLMHDAPVFNPRAAACLLAALSQRFVPGDICLAVVDPGVGNAGRRVLSMEADGVRYVGPDNGLFAVLAQRASVCRCREVLWQPDNLSHSFHGRDWFAPVVIRHFRGLETSMREISLESLVGMDWGNQIAEIIYIDHYGNAITGINAREISRETIFTAGKRELHYADTFSAVASGVLFWYENSMGLVEIAANSANAAELLGLAIGSSISTTARKTSRS